MTNIIVSANKTMFGKRTGKHTANLGDFHAEGTTATEAKTVLLQQIADYRLTKFILCSIAGDVFIITRGLSGQMEYAICGNGRTYASGCLMNTNDAKTAIEAARKHIVDSFGGVAWEHSF